MSKESPFRHSGLTENEKGGHCNWIITLCHYFTIWAMIILYGQQLYHMGSDYTIWAANIPYEQRLYNPTCIPSGFHQAFVCKWHKKDGLNTIILILCIYFLIKNNIISIYKERNKNISMKTR